MPIQPVLLLTADLHLGRGAWVRRPELQGDSYFALRQIVELALERNLEIVAAGDLIDVNRPDSDVIRELRDALETLQAADRQFFYIQGQHERSSPPWVQAVNSAACPLHKNYLETRGVSLYGLDYLPSADLRAELVRVPPDTQLLVLHQVWEEFMGSVCHCDASLTEIDGEPLVLTGDYHKHARLLVQRPEKPPLAVLSPGSTCMQSIDEEPRKQVFLLQDDGSNVSYPLSGRRLLEPPGILQSEEDLHAFLAALPRQLERAVDEAADLPDCLRKPLLRVRYDEGLADAGPRLTQLVGERAHLFLKPLRADTPERVLLRQRQEEAVGVGLVECLAEEVPETKSQLYQDSLRLLRSLDPEAELAKLRAEAGLSD